MTRRRRPARRQSRIGKLPISHVPFHSFTSATMSGVTGQVTTGLSPRSTALAALSAMATEYDLYRYERLEYRLHPVDPSNANIAVLSYYPDVDVQTLTIAQNGNSPVAACLSHFSGVPTPWIRVPRSLLKGMLDWYKCAADSGASEFESQGSLVFTSGASDVVYYEIRGVIAFKNPCPAALMLTRMKDLLRPDIEAEHLLRLSSTPSPQNKNTSDTPNTENPNSKGCCLKCVSGGQK